MARMQATHRAPRAEVCGARADVCLLCTRMASSYAAPHCVPLINTLALDEQDPGLFTLPVVATSAVLLASAPGAHSFTPFTTAIFTISNQLDLLQKLSNAANRIEIRSSFAHEGASPGPRHSWQSVMRGQGGRLNTCACNIPSHCSTHALCLSTIQQCVVSLTKHLHPRSSVHCTPPLRNTHAGTASAAAADNPCTPAASRALLPHRTVCVPVLRWLCTRKHAAHVIMR